VTIYVNALPGTAPNKSPHRRAYIQSDCIIAGDGYIRGVRWTRHLIWAPIDGGAPISAAGIGPVKDRCWDI
jgi:hypothetical protein